MSDITDHECEPDPGGDSRSGTTEHSDPCVGVPTSPDPSSGSSSDESTLLTHPCIGATLVKTSSVTSSCKSDESNDHTTQVYKHLNQNSLGSITASSVSSSDLHISPASKSNKRHCSHTSLRSATDYPSRVIGSHGVRLAKRHKFDNEFNGTRHEKHDILHLAAADPPNNGSDALLNDFKLSVRVSHRQVVDAWSWSQLHHNKWKEIKKIDDNGTAFLQKMEGARNVRAVKRLMKDRYSAQDLSSLILVMDRPDLFVQFLGWYESDSYIFYAMEYLGHGNLGRYMISHPQEVTRNSRDISRQILEGLSVLHQRNICHRDLKPQNVLIASLCPIRVKLTDFGILKCGVSTSTEVLLLGRGTEYMAPQVLSDILPLGGGTEYIAPEVLSYMSGRSQKQRAYTSAVDIWALGCLVYQMIAGTHSFMLTFLGRHKELDTNIKRLNDSFAIDFVQKLLIKDPRKRLNAFEALNHPWITSQKTTITGTYHDSLLPVDLSAHDRCCLDVGSCVKSPKRNCLTSDHLESSTPNAVYVPEINSETSSLFNKYKLRTKFKRQVVIHGSSSPESGEWVQEPKRIGCGASGSVFVQKMKGTEKKRAVKRLCKDNLEKLGQAANRELETLISVMDCPNHFVQFRGWYESDNFVFYVMEYLEQGDLYKYIKEFPQEAALNSREITKQIIKSLVILHERGICHRDLKPRNVLIASRSPIIIKIADFGTSQCEASGKMRTPRVGTQGYTAPEVLGVRSSSTDYHYTYEVDMWSLGCLVYRMLSKEAPFVRDQYFDTQALVNFCNSQDDITNAIPFDFEDLQALDFVKKLLVPNARLRMTATQALNHPWILNSSSLEPCD